MLIQSTSKSMSGSLSDLLSKQPQSNIIIFKLNLENVIEDQTLITRAAKICCALDVPYRLLLNSVFCDYSRLIAFVTAPSSLNGHHAEVNGNFRHTIEVVEQLIQFCATRPYINKNLAVLTALLHDSGKAVDYQTKFGRV